MNKYILISCLAIMGLTISCTGDKNTTDETSVPENGLENTITPTDNTTSDQQASPSSEQPVTDPAVASPAPAPGNVATIPNPAHGEPKHRCEVPVGTPIPADGSAPAVSAQASQPQNIQMQSGAQTMPINAAPGQSPAPAPTTIMNAPTQPSAPSGPTAAGMNPPHGEPGHDCAIPVGQPLKK